MEADLMDRPQRKHPRLKEYDYSQNGYYYVTVCTEKNEPILSRVGRGLAPAEPCTVSLTAIGETIRQQLLALETRYPHVKIDRYIIMPTHIHVIISLSGAAGASPRPTLMDVMGTWKSLTTRLCNQSDGTPGRKLFQTSFYERVIRNEAEYREICHYMEENPAKWLEMDKS